MKLNRIVCLAMATVLVVWFALILVANEVQAAPSPSRTPSRTWQMVKSLTPTATATLTPTKTPPMSTVPTRNDEAPPTPDCLVLICTQGYPPEVAAVCPPPQSVATDSLCYSLTQTPR